MRVACTCECSLASNNLTNFGRDVSGVVKLVETFTKMPQLISVK